MSFFLHFTDERPDPQIKQAISKTIAEAITYYKNQTYEGEWATGGIGIASIRPYHIQAGGAAWGSSNYWASSYAASVTWEAWINITQTDLAYEILTGYFNLGVAPKTVEFYHTMAGKALPTVNIEEFYALDVSRFYWKKPMTISPSKPWEVRHKGIDTGVEREGLTGYTVGPHSFLILRA